MFAYKVVECSLVVGMELGGCKVPEVNMALFLTTFLRFLEMLVVYVFLEKEALKRMRLKIRSMRVAVSTSHATSICNMSDESMDEERLERDCAQESAPQSCSNQIA
jgi:hypothetical protein